MSKHGPYADQTQFKISKIKISGSYDHGDKGFECIQKSGNCAQYLANVQVYVLSPGIGISHFSYIVALCDFDQYFGKQNGANQISR